jgi:hypothetical protein
LAGLVFGSVFIFVSFPCPSLPVIITDFRRKAKGIPEKSRKISKYFPETSPERGGYLQK